MGDAPRFVGVETPDHFPAGAYYAHVSIFAAEEKALGTGAYARDFVVLEERPCLIVAELDLADFEEVECFPLARKSISYNQIPLTNQSD